ncbi:PIN domain-containing protein [Corynebacterium bovis]|uniref:PIN domain-containing protein n=1 Tax=Corynebacterium bovis TaxID=36808 RepID=UPI003139263B
MTTPRRNSVLVDSTIWASATLHSWFGLIAAEAQGEWSFHWTEDILAEAVRARRRRFPTSSSTQMENIRNYLMAVMGDNKIERFPTDTTVEYPDPGDAHVHSAAVFGNISYLVTDNIHDFEPLYADPDERPYELYTSDAWLMLAAESAPDTIDSVILQQHEYNTRRASPHNLVSDLGKTSPAFAEYVRQRLQKLT